MPGIDSPASANDAADPAVLVDPGLHFLPAPHEAGAAGRTARGRRSMLAVLLVCALPVVASYLTYFFIRPAGRTNYSELIEPRPLPASLRLVDLQGQRVAPESLRGQWLLVVVAGGGCDRRCERHLWLQRQLHETLGRDKDRVDKLWLVDDAARPRSETLAAIGALPPSPGAGPDATAGGAPTPARVLVADRTSLASWLQPAPGRSLEEHLYVVDPRGDWMLRVPVDAEPARLKGDIEKLLRASAGWDRPGR